MWRSKRFIAFGVGVALFILMVYTTKHPPLEIAGAIAIICAIYTAAETLRGSTPESE